MTPRKPQVPNSPPEVKNQTAFNPDPLGDNSEELPGETPDAEVVSEAADEYEAVFVQSPALEPIVEKPERRAKPEAKASPPSLDEWQDFIGRFVIRGLTEAYLNLALSDFEDELTPRERESIRLTQEDLREMAAPIASLAHKSKFARRKGRAIIAAADSGEAVIALLIWMRRVSRIAKKYRKPKQPKTVPGYIVEEPKNGNHGPNVGEGPEYGGGFGVFNPGTG